MSLNEEKPVTSLRSPQFVLSAILFVLISAVVGVIMAGDPVKFHDLQVMAATMVVGRGLEALFKFWLNSSSDSEKKNDTINTLVNKAP